MIDTTTLHGATEGGPGTTRIVHDMRRRRGVAGRLGAAALALILAACGGGGGTAADDTAGATPSPAAPPAVTQELAEDGGDVATALEGGAHATLHFPARSLAAPAKVTVTPLAPEAGEWMRLAFNPALGTLAGTPTLRVRPPAAFDAKQIPVLQLATPAGPLLLRTRLLAHGELEAALPPALSQLEPTTDQAALSVGRVQKPGTAGRLAKEAGSDGSIVAGTAFLATCEAGPAVLAEALRVIESASSGSAVYTALTTLALVADRCARPGVLDEAGLQRIIEALDDLGRRLPGIYANALAAWKAVDYGWFEVQFDPFMRGVRRLLALCAAAREIGADLACPRTEDFEPEFQELANGFAAAADERQHQGTLRLLFERLLPLVPEAQLYGLPAAERDLREALARIADRLMDRAYALCSHGELFEWRLYVAQGGYSRRGDEAVQRAIAYCGVQASASAVLRREDGSEQRGEAREFAPGDLDGRGRTLQHALPVKHEGLVAIAVGGESTRCSRVIGMPQANEVVSVRAGTVSLATIELNSAANPERRERREVQLSVRHLLETLGRRADSMDTIELAVWREPVAPLHCFDSQGGLVLVQAGEVRLFTIELDFGTLRPETGALPEATVGRRYEARLRALGGRAPHVWSATGLPAGLQLDATSGLVSGTPPHEAIGRHPVALEVRDAEGQSVRLVRELEVAPLVLQGEILLTTTHTMTRDDSISLFRQHSNGTARLDAQSRVLLSVTVRVPRPGEVAQFELRGQTVEGNLALSVIGRETGLVQVGPFQCTVGYDVTHTITVPALTRSHVGDNTRFGRLTVNGSGSYEIDFGLEGRHVLGSGERRTVRTPLPPLQPDLGGCGTAVGQGSIENVPVEDGTPYYRTHALQVVPADGASEGAREFTSESSEADLRDWGVRQRIATTVRWNLQPR